MVIDVGEVGREAGSTSRTPHPFNLGSVILECVSAASAFGDPNKEVPKALYFFGVFDESNVGSPNALTMFARSRMTDNSASRYSNFFTGSEAGTQVTYPLGIAEFLQQSEALAAR